MKKRHIDSELPSDHWKMLKVKNRVVLDLGCGRSGDYQSTPEYFLSKGASRVYGVEMSHSEKPYYEENVKDERLRVFLDKVETAEQLHYYLMLLSPQVIKMDIEGDERLLDSVDIADMEGVQEIAVEYHGQAMRHLIEHNYNRLGFTVIKFYTLYSFDPEESGVIYLRK